MMANNFLKQYFGKNWKLRKIIFLSQKKVKFKKIYISILQIYAILMIDGSIIDLDPFIKDSIRLVPKNK